MSLSIIVILFFGAGLPLLSFLMALHYLKKNRKREDRINRVVETNFENPNKAGNPLQHLLLSGVFELENSSEIVEACYRIKEKGGPHFIFDQYGLASDDLKSFFDYVSVNQIDFNETPIQKAVQTYKEAHQNSLEASSVSI